MSYTVSILYDTPVKYPMVVAMEHKIWMQIFAWKLTCRPWNMLVGRRYLLFRGLVTFQGQTIKLPGWIFYWCLGFSFIYIYIYGEFPLPCPCFPGVPSFQGVVRRIGTWPAKLWSLASGPRHKAARMDGQHSSLEMLQFLLSFGIEVVIEKRRCLRPLLFFGAQTHLNKNVGPQCRQARVFVHDIT